MDKTTDLWKQIADRYEVQKTLGSGTFGHVKKAKCLKTGREVAIKLLKDSLQTSY